MRKLGENCRQLEEFVVGEIAAAPNRSFVIGEQTLPLKILIVLFIIILWIIRVRALPRAYLFIIYLLFKIS